MTADPHISKHYPAHLAAQQAAWEEALTAEGFDSAIIHAGSERVSFLDDYHYSFRPNPHFLSWVPLTRHPESVLVVRPGQQPVLYYYQPSDYWELPPADPEEWWAEHFTIRITTDPGEWRAGVPLGRECYIGDAPDIAGESDINPMHVLNRIHLHRARKTDYEIACIWAATKTAVRAHRAAEQAFREGLDEYAIHLRYLEAASATDADLPYGSIVALNEHGAVLHYQLRDRSAPADSRSFLIDAGATQFAYCADITRTYAAGEGLFAEMIAALDEVQQRLAAGMLAGEDYRERHLEAHREIATLLERFGIIKAGVDEAVESGLSGVFFPHGLGHFLGLQTHDVAGLFGDPDGHEIPRPRGHPFLRLTRTLEPGNVLTVEPGIYFIPSLLERWKRRGNAARIDWDKVEELAPYGGIRIEDNVVVTEEGAANLTREAFAEAGGTSS